MAGEMQLPPWLSVNNTELMPRAMAVGAQVGNVIADNRRMAQVAQQNAALAKQKQVQEAIRYQGFQEYQRDLANGVDAGEAIKKHGAKMYFGETVFPQMLNAMERNAEAQRYHDQIEAYRKIKESNDRLNDEERNRLTGLLRETQAETLEANKLKNKEAIDLGIKKVDQNAEQFIRKLQEDQRQFGIIQTGKEADRAETKRHNTARELADSITKDMTRKKFITQLMDDVIREQGVSASKAADLLGQIWDAKIDNKPLPKLPSETAKAKPFVWDERAGTIKGWPSPGQAAQPGLTPDAYQRDRDEER